MTTMTTTTTVHATFQMKNRYERTRDLKGYERERKEEKDRREKNIIVNKIENAVVVSFGAVVGRMFSHNNEFYFCSIAIAQCIIRLTVNVVFRKRGTQKEREREKAKCLHEFV